ncbi:MAG: PDDEXK nuclease domain-containing protein [Gemmatimonadota bacterium]
MKERISGASVRAVVAVNRELVQLYWQVGRDILARQDAVGWGGKVVDRLSADLRRAFPEMTGFSGRNLRYMRAFAAAYPDEAIVQQAVAQIAWGHNVVLLDKLENREDRLWYAAQALEHGWSRNVLVHQIESRLHLRQGRAITNFDATLPSPQSDLARELLKDPYNFGFLGLEATVQERNLERGLLAHLKDFLLELGLGFAFVGSQYPLDVEGSEYRLDLLFYHLRLRCYVVIDLKMGRFEPEFAGKMNFYLAAVDERIRHQDDNASIGLILCKERNRLVVEYALRGMSQPMGVAEYRHTATLPEGLEGALPTVAELENELRTTESVESAEEET